MKASPPKLKVFFKSVFLIALLLSFRIAHAQDSLITIIETAKDSFLIDALIQKAREIRLEDRQLALEYQKRAYHEADRLNYHVRKARALNGIGISYAMLEDYPNALYYFKEYMAVQDFLGNKAGVAEAYNNLGNTYRYIGDFPESIRMHLLSLQICDSLDSSSGRSAALHNLGIVHDLTGDLDQSLNFFKQAYKIRVDTKDEFELPSTIHSLALVSERLGMIDSALYFMRLYLSEVKDHGQNPKTAGMYNTIGRLFMAQSRTDSAEFYLKKSIELSRSLEIKIPLIHALHNLSKLYFQVNNYPLALATVEESILVAQAADQLLFLKDGYSIKSKIYKALGQYENAYTNLEKSMTLLDSINKDEKVKALKQWQVKLDVYEKEKQIRDQDVELQWLNKQNKTNKQNRILLITALVLSVFTGLVFYNQNRFRKRANTALVAKNQFIAEQKKEIERINQELEARMLRAQINPHFIFNSLSSIQHFIVTNEKHSALKYLAKFSTLLRQILEESVSGKVSLKDEIHLITIYLELEALRFDDTFSYKIEVDEKLDIDNLEIPILIIQPFIENALFHGLLPSRSAKQLKIHFTDEDQYIICRIEDNGIGRKAAALLKMNSGLQKTPSRGVEVSQNRLITTYKNDNPEDLIRFRDVLLTDGTPAGTEVIIKIPKE